MGKTPERLDHKGNEPAVDQSEGSPAEINPLVALGNSRRDGNANHIPALPTCDSHSILSSCRFPEVTERARIIREVRQTPMPQELSFSTVVFPSSAGLPSASAIPWLVCPIRSLRFTRFSLLPNGGNRRRLLRGVVGFQAELRDQTPSILSSDATRLASD